MLSYCFTIKFKGKFKIMKIIKQIHPIHLEYKKAKKEGRKLSELMGKYQYIYSSEKGQISLVFFKDYFRQGDNFWEIYCIDNSKLFKDVERFDTKKEAEKAIKKYLI